jgi:aldehyde:ferredoxin oxidoreductase
MPAYDPRAAKNQGLNYATSVVGANHNIGYSAQEIFNSPVPRPLERFSESGKADVCIFNQTTTTVCEFGIVCTFPGGLGMILPDMLAKLLASALGMKELGSEEYLFQAAERVYNLEKVFDLREGFRSEHDTLPERIQKETLLEAEAATGQQFSNVKGLVQEYYQARGWTKQGFPPPEKLRALGLDSAAEDMEKIIQV